MGGFLGADTAALREHGSVLTARAGEVEDLAARLAAMVDQVNWIGPDAEEFRSDWAVRVRPALHDCSDAIRSRADEIDTHAEEQDGASDVGGLGGTLTNGAGDAPVLEMSADSIQLASMSTPLQAFGALGDLFDSVSDGVGTVVDSVSDGVGTVVDGTRESMLFFTAGKASGDIGESTLQFDDSGMQLEPPKTTDTVKVSSGDDLYPSSDSAPFGIDKDGAQIELEPNTRYSVGERGEYYTDGDGRIVYVEAEGGGKEMNPNLRQVLPDVTYHVNDKTYYQTDELGRTEHMYIPEVEVDRDMSRSQSIQSKIADRFDMKTPDGTEKIEFNAGHMEARQLGGIREEINYTRQWDEVNQARKGTDNIYAFESLLVDGIEDGKSYSYETRVTFGDQQPPGVGKGSEPWEYVPESYDVAIHENGKQVVDAHLPNYPDGATFVKKE